MSNKGTTIIISLKRMLHTFWVDFNEVLNEAIYLSKNVRIFHLISHLTIVDYFSLKFIESSLTFKRAKLNGFLKLIFYFSEVKN